MYLVVKGGNKFVHFSVTIVCTCTCGVFSRSLSAFAAAARIDRFRFAGISSVQRLQQRHRRRRETSCRILVMVDSVSWHVNRQYSTTQAPHCPVVYITITITDVGVCSVDKLPVNPSRRDWRSGNLVLLIAVRRI